MKLLPFDFSNIYTICYNGAEIYKDDELIYKKHFDSEVTENIVNWFLIKYPKVNISLEISNHFN